MPRSNVAAFPVSTQNPKLVFYDPDYDPVRGPPCIGSALARSSLLVKPGRERQDAAIRQHGNTEIGVEEREEQISVGIVIIGRNEGDRLRRALASAAGLGLPVVYVDSASRDDSVAVARAADVKVVELDSATPLSAARGRNAGFDTLGQDGAAPDFVQFIDGDCEIVPGWIQKAARALQDDDGLGLVTGWRSEIDRDASVYNQMCDYEWHGPTGEITACGGDMMVRARAFREIGGFNPRCISGEDGELCFRMRKAGWRLLRLPEDMTRHDAAMRRFGEWWQRTRRNGHGMAHVATLHPDFFLADRRRAWFYGAVLPALALLSAPFTPWIPLAVGALYGASYLRTVQGLHKGGLTWHEAAIHALYFTLAKLPNAIGMLTYHWRRLRGHQLQLIEYK